MTSKQKAKKLHEIADALEEWGKYNEKVTNVAEWGTSVAKQIIRKAMTLLVDNLVLLNECKNKYGCYSPLQQCFVAIEQAASWPKTKDLGDCKGWTNDFAECRLWGGEQRSLADECVRYANEVDKETERGRKESKKKENFYQTNTFKFVVIPLLGILVMALMGIPAWILLFNKTTDQNIAQTANIFAYVSKEGAILQSKNFPWAISKSKDDDNNIVYIIEGRYGDSSAASIVPDDPKNTYIVYNATSGVAVKFTCPEEKISNFTIKLKY